MTSIRTPSIFTGRKCITMFDAKAETKKQQVTRNQIQSYLAQAKFDLDQGDLETSLEFYYKASYLQQPWTLELASTHLKIAAILLSQKVCEAALVHLKEARDILDQGEQDCFAADCVERISLIDQLIHGLRTEHSSSETACSQEGSPELEGHSNAGEIPDIISILTN